MHLLLLVVYRACHKSCFLSARSIDIGLVMLPKQLVLNLQATSQLISDAPLSNGCLIDGLVDSDGSFQSLS